MPVPARGLVPAAAPAPEAAASPPAACLPGPTGRSTWPPIKKPSAPSGGASPPGWHLFSWDEGGADRIMRSSVVDAAGGLGRFDAVGGSLVSMGSMESYYWRHACAVFSRAQSASSHPFLKSEVERTCGAGFGRVLAPLGGQSGPTTARAKRVGCSLLPAQGPDGRGHRHRRTAGWPRACLSM